VNSYNIKKRNVRHWNNIKYNNITVSQKHTYNASGEENAKTINWRANKKKT
jgi:hypothetical protein